jgi:hypothetical protein
MLAEESNYQIDTSALTELKLLNMTKVSDTNPKRVVTTSGIFYLAVLVIAVIALIFIEEWKPKIVISIILIVSIIWWLITWTSILFYRTHAYALREKDVTIDEGIFFKSRQTTPYHRIQHVEISQGPIQKKFNHSTLKIFAAGGNGTSTEIRGIEKEEAEHVRQFLLDKVTSY